MTTEPGRAIRNQGQNCRYQGKPLALRSVEGLARGPGAFVCRAVIAIRLCRDSRRDYKGFIKRDSLLARSDGRSWATISNTSAVLTDSSASASARTRRLTS